MPKMARLAGSCSLTLLALTGVASAEPRWPTHVACVGDSITAGMGATSPAKNYVSVLQGLLGNAVQVKNFGNSGATMLTKGYGDKPYTKQVEYTNATNFVKDAGATAVVSVVIILGANDSKPQNWEPAGGKNDQQYLKDYRALVEHFAGLPTKPVIYLGYPLATGNNPCCGIRGDIIHDEQLPLIKQLAMEKHLPIIDLNTPTTGHPEYFDDGVHPNDAGYAVMAGLVKKGLEREPSVSSTSGASNGGTATAGAGGVVATGGTAGSASGAPSSSGRSSVVPPKAPTSTTEANCGCSTPGARSNNVAAWLLVASALTLRASTGRRPASTPRPTASRRRGRRGSRAPA